MHEIESVDVIASNGNAVWSRSPFTIPVFATFARVHNDFFNILFWNRSTKNLLFRNICFEYEMMTNWNNGRCGGVKTCSEPTFEHLNGIDDARRRVSIYSIWINSKLVIMMNGMKRESKWDMSSSKWATINNYSSFLDLNKWKLALSRLIEKR